MRRPPGSGYCCRDGQDGLDTRNGVVRGGGPTLGSVHAHIHQVDCVFCSFFFCGFVSSVFPSRFSKVRVAFIRHFTLFGVQVQQKRSQNTASAIVGIDQALKKKPKKIRARVRKLVKKKHNVSQPKSRSRTQKKSMGKNTKKMQNSHTNWFFDWPKSKTHEKTKNANANSPCIQTCPLPASLGNSPPIAPPPQTVCQS